MTAGSYPRERIEDIRIETKLRLSCRIIPRQSLTTPLGIRPGDSRFCSKAAGYTILYSSPDLATAFIETVVRDRFARQARREVPLREVTERVWAQISTKSNLTLRLLDLRKDGCVRLGAPTDAVNARNHAAGRALGRAIYRGHKDVDGLLFASRLTGGDVFAVFDRAIFKLASVKTGELKDHPGLPGVLAKHRIRLVVRH